MDRKTARAHAMKLIYEWQMGGEGGNETCLNLLGVEPDEREVEYMNRMYNGVIENIEAIDAKITEYARGWNLDRLMRVDLSIMRLGTYELMLGEVPAGVAINEAVELANVYSTDNAGSFINGVLGSISRSLTR